MGYGPEHVHPDDWDLFSDAAFLVDHPAWTWRDLQETPDDVVEWIRRWDTAQPKVTNGRHVPRR